jgi:hypothetical protein
MKTNIFSILCLGLNAYAQKRLARQKTYKTEIKTSRLDFNVNLRTSHYGGTSNKRQHDCHWLYPLCSGQKTKLYRWLLGGAGLMENTLK